jgi:hypothetical protein
MPALGPGTSADLARPAQPALDPNILAAFSDPLALEVFSSVTSRAVPATATAIAELLVDDRELIAGRLAALEGWKLLERVSDPSGAAAEPTFRATREALLTDEEWAQLVPGDRRRVLTPLLEMVTARIWSAFDRGGFDAPDVHVSRVPAELDREGYEEMVALGAELLERAREIQVGVVQRRAEGGAEAAPIKTELVFLHFLRHDGRTAPPAGAGDDLLERAFATSEDVADGLALAQPDWQSVAARAREMAALAERLGAAAPAPDAP